eukprot:GGOE01061170.1.p2 GENE.GGOE01061170.1~~GGOE01061170.1.p2  ORF type:complete len:234 (-),score=81.54 GGOE01061170.1:201-875(-)
MAPKKVSFKDPKNPKRPAPKKYKVKVSAADAAASGADQFIKKKKQRMDPSKAGASKKRKAEGLVEVDSLPESKRARLTTEFRDVCVACDRIKLAQAIVKKLYDGVAEATPVHRINLVNVTFKTPQQHQGACGKDPQSIFGQTVTCKTLAARSHEHAVVHLGNRILLHALKSVWPNAVAIVEMTPEAVRLRFDSPEEAQEVIDTGRKLILDVPFTPRSLWGIKGL